MIAFRAVRLPLSLSLVFVLSIAGRLFASAATTGAIEGFATDIGSHPIADVGVTVVSPSGRGSTTTGADGYYALNGLPLDTYSVTFTKSGYISQAVVGVTTSPDQTMRVNVKLFAGIKTLAHVAVRSATSLLQPTVTTNTYIVTASHANDVLGTPQDENGLGALAALPGISLDSFGSPVVRGSATNEIGFTYDDVTNVEPATGGFINNLSMNGTRSLEVSTGGFDVSVGNTNAGAINQVIERGAYPGHGEATMRVMGGLFGHELSIDYGDATPDNRFSFYVGFGGQDDAVGYGDRSTIFPTLAGFDTFDNKYDDVVNLFYHFGKDGVDEVQFLTDLSGDTSQDNYLEDAAVAPYASDNGDVQASSDPFGLCAASLAPPYPTCDTSLLQSNYDTPFPGQAGTRQLVGAPDTFVANSIIDKLNFKRQLTPSSFAQVRLYRTTENLVDSQPYNTGSFGEFYADVNVTSLGEAFDYAGQLSSEHELGFGGEATYYVTTAQGAQAPSLEPAFEPLEDLGCPQIAAAIAGGLLIPTGAFHSMPGIGGCYIAPFNAALDAAVSGLDLPTDSRHAPLRSYVDDFLEYDVPEYRYDAWIKDRYQPNQRLTVTYGLRMDREDIPVPADTAALDSTYYIDGSGNVVTVPGHQLGPDVTRPTLLSPRLAASYALDRRDALRFSYGKSIEFASLYAMIRPFQVPSSLKRCTIVDGCFIPLPGYGATNHVTNLYDQVMLDLTTNMSEQYGHVLPQLASNIDLSWSHEFSGGIELRLTPYYRKGTQYAVTNQPLLFRLPTSGTPVFGASQQESIGVNESTGVELALQRAAPHELSSLFDVTYDNTLANYDGDFVPAANDAAVAAGHYFHVTYDPALVGTLNLAYEPQSRWHASTTLMYESGYRYGVGKKAFVFINGIPTQVLNTDLAQGAQQAYYFTNPSDPGTLLHPNIIASRGTPEGDDPGTLLSPAVTIVRMTISHDFGAQASGTQVGIRVQNLLGDYAPTIVNPNPYYVPLGNGGSGPGSGRNTNRCAPGQTFGCEPLMYDYGKGPYEIEHDGAPRVFTFFITTKL